MPQQGEPQAESEQEQDPGRDRYRRRRRPAGEGDAHGVDRVRSRCGSQQDQERQPRVQLGPPPPATQRKGGGRGDYEHGVEDQRIQLGEGGRDPGGQGDRVDARIRQYERGGGQQDHTRDHGDERRQP
jgi:hypothetical protein